MHPTVRAQIHQPLIKFLGKRHWPSSPDVPHTHPAAPAELKERFTSFFLRPAESQAEGSSLTQDNKSVFEDFWQAPTRYWKPRVREIEEKEMDAVMSGGASSY
ncbi:uncharacterized protein LACBIDRAFT_294900 [Laccaria bicolor S238N-H82]|uniref:Predicted protein n=1 Tax=Laccaria bicolor (strain S238N-H82 / ATCC MYA-4686) TaxID=486041 RepID=B0DK19_LACBS|nr:uncharacterized protein LACBIDRAFT_294900 [Laccaria bicolor S238N-H82]EDR04864.1 predicted protein [Laccaria bicolor S238N-H82]|eukprot:XP_001884254.1 predicted protein [Laccaria bicolor S238N-H82]